MWLLAHILCTIVLFHFQTARCELSVQLVHNLLDKGTVFVVCLCTSPQWILNQYDWNADFQQFKVFNKLWGLKIMTFFFFLPILNIRFVHLNKNVQVYNLLTSNLLFTSICASLKFVSSKKKIKTVWLRSGDQLAVEEYLISFPWWPYDHWLFLSLSILFSSHHSGSSSWFHVSKLF